MRIANLEKTASRPFAQSHRFARDFEPVSLPENLAERQMDTGADGDGGGREAATERRERECAKHFAGNRAARLRQGIFRQRERARAATRRKADERTGKRKGREATETAGTRERDA